MIDVLAILQETLNGRVDDWSSADRETAKAVGLDLAKMQATLIGGGEVDPVELELVKAAAKNLAAAAVFSGAAAMMELLERLATVEPERSRVAIRRVMAGPP